MFDWLMLLLAPVMPNATPPEKDYIGVVAAEVAYAALLPSAPPVAPKPVDPKNCSTCGGTGKVRTGDGQGWTKCPTCQPINAPAPPANKPATPGWPPRPVGQPLGNCPRCLYQSFTHHS
jgi:hypothetical protein